VVRWYASPTSLAPGQLPQYGQYYRGAFRSPRPDNRTKLSRSKVRKTLKALPRQSSSMEFAHRKVTVMRALCQMR
jgi:hypothetical protein